MADVFGNQGQFTSSDISNFIAQNINNPQAIAQAAQQYGISSSDIQKAAGYTPTQQAEYLGGAGLPSLQPFTVQQLYTDVLGRAPDVEGQKFWASKFGETIDPTEIAEFRAAAAPELVSSAYQNVLGRAADKPGAEYYTSQLQSGALTTDQLRDALAYGAQGLEDRLAAQKAIGKDIFAPEEYLKGTSGFGYKDIVDYINANVQDPVKIAQASKEYGIDPNEIMQAYQGKSPYSLQQIQDYLTKGSEGFGTRFQDIVTSTIGDTEEQATLEKFLSLKAGDLSKTVFDPKKFSNLSIENIEKTLENSPANRYQEANRAANIMQNIYGASKEDALNTAKNLLQDKEVDKKTKNLYDQLLKYGLTEDVKTNILQDAAVRAPNSEFFKKNPTALTIYSPIGEIKRGEETSNTYGVDPRTNLPILHKKAFDNMLDKDGEVFIGGMQDMTDNIRHQYVGADPHSKWQGALARGTGVFGVTASKDDISDFARIEKELNRLGGVQRQVDPETGSAMDVVYVERKDPDNPERTYKVPVTAEQFFAMQMAGDKYSGAEDPSSVARYTRNFESTSAYDYYKNTKARLDEIAKDTYKDPSKTPQYKDIKDIYEDLNNKYKDLYLWQGRTDTLDPAAAKTLGIDDVKENSKHASILYTSANDKLVPVKVQRVYDFEDPNTSSGFFGDLFNNIMEVLSIKPISMALGAYLTTPGIDALTGAATPAPLSAATRSVANLLPSGLTGILPASITPDMIAKSIISSGIGALPAGTRGLDDYLKAFGTNLAGSGVQLGASALGAPSIVSRGLGTATTAALSDRDVVDALTRLGTSEGIGALLQNVPTGDFDKNLLAAFAPAILSGRLTPADLMRIAQVTNPPPKK
jgi:hypothetical protein